ncbi:MAG: hypothetical protein ACLFNY_02710 [Candidatus Aenigmatarchaeota archaeon]
MRYSGLKRFEIGFLSSFLTFIFWKSHRTSRFNVSSSIRAVIADIISYDFGLLIMYIFILIGAVGLVIWAIYLEKSSDHKMTQSFMGKKLVDMDAKTENRLNRYRACICVVLFSVSGTKILVYGQSFDPSPSLTATIIYFLSYIGIFILFSLAIIETDGFFKKFIENKALFPLLGIIFILCGVTFMVNIWRVEGSEISDLYHYYTISIWITMAVISGLRALEIRKNRSTFWNSITVIMIVLFAIYLIWAMLELGLI